MSKISRNPNPETHRGLDSVSKLKGINEPAADPASVETNEAQLCVSPPRACMASYSSCNVTRRCWSQINRMSQTGFRCQVLQTLQHMWLSAVLH